MRLGAVSGPHTGRVVQVEGELTVGRSMDCALTLNDPKVSRRHATIMRDAARALTLRDEGSLNGTWVNDRRIGSPTGLTVGDRVRIGSSEFVVFADHEPWGNDILTEEDFEQLLSGETSGETAADHTLVMLGDTT